MKFLRQYIRLLIEEEILGEPDLSSEEDREEEESHHDEQSAGGVPGPMVPLGMGSAAKRKKRRQRAEKANASAFGGAKIYKK
jgi:hypothetical protein